MNTLQTVSLLGNDQVQEYSYTDGVLRIVFNDHYKDLHQLIRLLKAGNYNLESITSGGQNIILLRGVKKLFSDESDTIRFRFNDKVILIFDLLQDNFLINIPY